MDTDTFVDALQTIGLSDYQANAYVALLEKGNASASELADASGVPQPRMYDVLRDLEERGYVETYEQDTIRARVPDPTTAVEDIAGLIDDLEGAKSEVEERWTPPTVHSHEVSVVSSSETIRNRMRAFVTDAEEFVQLAISSAELDWLRSTLEDAHERGVHVQLSVYSPASHSDELTVEDFENICTEARVQEGPAPTLAVVDHQRVCYAEGRKNWGEYGVIIEGRWLVYVFSWFYLTTLWEFWDPLYDDRDTEPPITYYRLRRCIAEIEPLLEDDAIVTARVVGRIAETREPCEIRGKITDIEHEGASRNFDTLSTLRLAGRATIYVETDERTVSVGGPGTRIEDVEADKIVVNAILE